MDRLIVLTLSLLLGVIPLLAFGQNWKKMLSKLRLAI